MCGIAGFFSAAPVAPGIARRMHEALARRGPDARHAVGWSGAGAVASERVDPLSAASRQALLHTRLSIIDPRPLADQPMGNAAGDIWLCYNGEVYDWADDAAALSRAGVVFTTRSDTEFILHGYQAWGIDGLLARLRGMFAFAIFDRRRGEVHLVRDRLGEKPLLYSHVDGMLSFGSLVRSVLPALGPTRRNWSRAGLDAYLAHRYIPAPGTVFEHIGRLPAGHHIRYEIGSDRVDIRRYWSPGGARVPAAGATLVADSVGGASIVPTGGPGPGAPRSDWIDELDRAVRMRTVADRPLGMFLSGGIDSTVIASRLVAAGMNGVSTLTAAFPGSGMDEAPVAADSAARLGLAHEALPMPAGVADVLDQIVADLDEPFADPSCLPTWLLARAASERFKVVLVGDGGDELLAGYKRIAKHVRAGWRGRLRLDLPWGPALLPKGWGKLATELSMDWADAYALRFSGFTPAQRRFLQPGQALPSLVYWQPAAPAAADAAGEGASRADRARLALLAIDMANYLPEYVLRKSDLCTMAHGLEARAPMLDHHFVDAILALPLAERFTQPPKALFARALSPALPADFMTRPKRGFNPPLTGWLRGELAPRLADLGTRLAGLTDGQLAAEPVDALVRAYREGQESLAEQVLQLLLLAISLSQLRQISHTAD